ncbi:3923_t:CDS:2 [Paraglomus occultum]|uniref:3923_t:CDS:1 n=1 Tax=Paraglomus occultum TaxID=144539 RepID=A0A9N9GLC7_9GLOM|nr:3923_t:CDS:2 [Paraglomus occultum]
MELYPEISRLTLDDDEKTALFVHFTNKPAQKAEAAAVLSACNNDAARIRSPASISNVRRRSHSLDLMDLDTQKRRKLLDAQNQNVDRVLEIPPPSTSARHSVFFNKVQIPPTVLNHRPHNCLGPPVIFIMTFDPLLESMASEYQGENKRLEALRNYLSTIIWPLQSIKNDDETAADVFKRKGKEDLDTGLLNYFVDPDGITAKIRDRLLSGHSVLMYGHRQSGKSTCAFSLLRSLRCKEYDVFVIAFDKTIQLNDSKAFWQSLCVRMQSMYSKRFIISHDEVASGSFVKFFSKMENPSGKPAILIIDEASYLTIERNPVIDSITQEFLSTLRSIQQHQDSLFYSVLLIGTEGARCPREKWNKDSLKVDSSTNKTYEISLDIFKLTLGHKGLFGSCGGFIEASYQTSSTILSKLIPTAPIRTYEDWSKYTLADLPEYIKKLGAYNSIFHCLSKLTKPQRDILAKILREGTCDVNENNSNAWFLLEEGIAYAIEASHSMMKLQFSSPILHTLILKYIDSPPVSIPDNVPDPIDP